MNKINQENEITSNMVKRNSHISPLTSHFSEGISLITLIITIIVIIILAAIVIFTGLNTPERAQFAKFTQEFSGFQEAVTNEFLNEKMKLSTSGQYRTDEQIYYKIATGTDMQGTPTPNGMVADLGFELQGTKFYQITKEEIAGVKIQSKFTDGADNLYITDKGEVFALPGFLVEENGTNRWYVDASHYYEDETGVDHATTLSEKGYRVGQAVDYHPSANAGYATQTEVETGVTVKADTYPEDVTWHILSVNDRTGVIKITPGVVNASKVTLSGEEVYFNPAKGLDKVCNALYKNEDLKLPVTCMTYDELNYAAGDFHPSTTYSETDTYNVAYFPNDATVTSITSGEILLDKEGYFIVSGDANTLTVNENGTMVSYRKKTHGSTTYAFYTGNGIVMYGGRTGAQVHNRECKEPYKDGDNKYHPIFVRTTWYNYNPSAADKEPELANVLGTTNYGWLASPCVNAGSSRTIAYFYVRCAYGGGVGGTPVAYSDGTSRSPSIGLLPVVSLNAAHLTGAGKYPDSGYDPGSDENPWGIK